MHRALKVKASAIQLPLRKSALTASAASRRRFPAWISADEGTVALPAVAVTLRVRDALVLRTVSRKKSEKAKNPSGSHGAR